MKFTALIATLALGFTVTAQAQTTYQIAGRFECTPSAQPSPSPSPSNWPKTLQLKKVTVYNQVITEGALGGTQLTPIRYADRNTWFNQTSLMPASGRDIRTGSYLFMTFENNNVPFGTPTNVASTPLSFDLSYRFPRTAIHRISKDYGKVPTYLGIIGAWGQMSQLPLINVGFSFEGHESSIAPGTGYLALQAVHPDDFQKFNFRTISKDFNLSCVFIKDVFCVNGYQIGTCPQ